MSLVAVRGTSREIITEVLGTRIVKTRPARNDLIGSPKVDWSRFLETSVAKTADMCFSLSLRESINSAQPMIMPDHAGMKDSNASIQGVTRSNREGTSVMPGILPKNRVPSSAILVKRPDDSSIGKNIRRVAKLYQ